MPLESTQSANPNDKQFNCNLEAQDQSIYNFDLQCRNSKFFFTLKKNLSPFNWENEFTLIQLTNEDKIWCFFQDNDDFFDTISEFCNENKILLIKMNDNCLIFQFKIIKKQFSF